MVLWLACLLLPGVGARAAEPDAAASDARLAVQEAFVIDRARAALAAGEPRRAMVAAIVYSRRRGAQSEEQIQGDAASLARKAELEQLVGQSIELALAAGADDALVQVFLALSCDQPWANCDADAALARLAEIEPDNGLAALMVMDRAHRRQRAEGELVAFQALARAKRIETHDAATLAAIRDFIGDADLPAAMVGEGGEAMTTEDRRAVAAFGYWLAIPRPGLSLVALAARCRAEPGSSDEHARCLAVARVFSEANDRISRHMGLSLLVDLVGDPDERARIRGLQRDLDWQRSAFFELTRDVVFSPGSPAAHFDTMIAAGGETGLMTKLLSEAGVPLTAPADWMPSDPRLRN